MTLLLCIVNAVGTLIAFCPAPCKTAGGLMEIANWSNLILGALATVALAMPLREYPKRRVPNESSKVKEHKKQVASHEAT